MEVKIKKRQITEKYLEIQIEKEDIDKIDEIIEKAKLKAMRIYDAFLLGKLNGIPKELSSTIKLYLLSRCVEIISNSINIEEMRRKGKQELFDYEFRNNPFFRKECLESQASLERLVKTPNFGIRARMRKEKAKK